MNRRALLAAALGAPLVFLGGDMEPEFRSEDLAPLLHQPKLPADMLRAAQGRVLEWNPETGQNKIEFRGVVLENVPIVASSLEVLQMKPDDLVMLHLMGTQATMQPYIVGRITKPGDAAREAIVGAMSTSIYSATVSTFETTGPIATITFVDLATPGPTLTDIPILTGRCLVTVSATMSHPGAAGGFGSAVMGFEITGSSTKAADPDWVLRFVVSNESMSLSASRMFLVDDLRPGLHTFKAKYANPSSSGNASFENRTITVIAF